MVLEITQLEADALARPSLGDVMGITYGDHLIDSGYYDITPEQERESEMTDFKYLGNFAACEPWAAQGMSCDNCMVSWTGCWDNFQCPKCGNGELPSFEIPGAACAEPLTVEADLDSDDARPNRGLDSPDRGHAVSSAKGNGND
jgi:hypothetical protein